MSFLTSTFSRCRFVPFSQQFRYSTNMFHLITFTVRSFRLKAKPTATCAKEGKEEVCQWVCKSEHRRNQNERPSSLRFCFARKRRGCFLGTREIIPPSSLSRGSHARGSHARVKETMSCASILGNHMYVLNLCMHMKYSLISSLDQMLIIITIMIIRIKNWATVSPSLMLLYLFINVGLVDSPLSQAG